MHRAKENDRKNAVDVLFNEEYDEQKILASRVTGGTSLTLGEVINDAVMSPFALEKQDQYKLLRYQIEQLPDQMIDKNMLLAFLKMDRLSFLVFVKDVLNPSLKNRPLYLENCDSLVQRLDGKKSSSFRSIMSSGLDVKNPQGRESIMIAILYILNNISDSTPIFQAMETHLEEDRTLSHRRRVVNLKKMKGLMKIINQNPVLSSKFREMKLPSSSFKNDTESTMVGNVHHRQLTAFRSMISRDESLQQLAYQEGMRIHRENSEKLWNKFESMEVVNIEHLRVGLGVNGGTMAETENRMLPEQMDKTLYLGQEDHYGGSFNFGGHLVPGFQTNSRVRSATVNDTMLPTSAGSINHPGMFSILGEADMHSGVYSNDSDRGFETFTKFYFNANTLLNAKVVYQKIDEQSDTYKVLLSNTKTGQTVQLSVDNMDYIAGLGVPKRGFDEYDVETADIIKENETITGEIIEREYNNYKNSRNFKNGSQSSREYLQSVGAFPKYIKAFDLLALYKNPNLDMLDILSGGRIVIGGGGDTASIIKEKLLIMRSNTPRQTLEKFEIIEIGKKKTKQIAKKGRLRYGQVGNFLENEDYPTDVWVYSAPGRSNSIRKKGNRCIVSIKGELEDVSQLAKDEIDFIEYDDGYFIDNVDLFVDCTGLDIKKGLDAVILTNQNSLELRPSNFGRTVANIFQDKDIGSVISFDNGGELILKNTSGDISEYDYLDVNFGYVSKDKSYQNIEIRIYRDELDELFARFSVDETYLFSRLLGDKISNPLGKVTRIETYSSYTDSLGSSTVEVTNEKQQEIVDIVFGDKLEEFDDISIYRKFSDDIGRTNLHGPCANIDLSQTEQSTFEKVAIKENAAARFRAHFRLSCAVLENYSNKRIKAINTPGNDIFKEEYKRVDLDQNTNDGDNFFVEIGDVDRILKTSSPPGLEVVIKELLLGSICDQIEALDIRAAGEPDNISISFRLSNEKGTGGNSLVVKGDNDVTGLLLNEIGLTLDDHVLKYIINMCKIKKRKTGDKNQQIVNLTIPWKVEVDKSEEEEKKGKKNGKKKEKKKREKKKEKDTFDPKPIEIDYNSLELGLV